MRIPRHSSTTSTRTSAATGQRVWVSWTNRIVWDENGNVEEVLSIGTDISAQVEAHEAMRRTEEQFRLNMENLAEIEAIIAASGPADTRLTRATVSAAARPPMRSFANSRAGA